MADENTMPEIPDDINLDEESDAVENEGAEAGKKSRKIKISFNFLNPKLLKILMWVGIGSVVIIAEVVIAYLLINKFIMAKQFKQLEQFEVVEPIQPEAAESKTGEEAQQSRAELDLPQLSDEAAPDMKKVGGLFTLADVVVNPAMSQGKRYFVVTIVCTFENKKMVDKITILEPVIQDRLNTLLSSKTVQWYSNFTNRTLLKREIMATVMQVLDIDEGVNIYFTKYVIQ